MDYDLTCVPDPMKGTKEEAQAHEAQAIGRAYRQGQEKKVTIVRFIVEDTLEEELYRRNNPREESTLPPTLFDDLNASHDSGKPSFFRSNSITTLAAFSPEKLRSYLEEEEDTL